MLKIFFKLYEKLMIPNFEEIKFKKFLDINTKEFLRVEIDLKIKSKKMIAL